MKSIEEWIDDVFCRILESKARAWAESQGKSLTTNYVQAYLEAHA
jgi:hypothetical protein